MFINEDTNEALVFGTYAIKKPKHTTKTVRVDRKRTKQLGTRRVIFGDKVKYEHVSL